MPLFMPQDPPDSLGEFKPLGPAKRSQPKEEPGKYEETGTPGIVRNSKTGMLETDLPEPEPERKLIPLEEPKTVDKSLEDVVAEYQKRFQEHPNEFFQRNFTVSTPRQQGKSLIQEMYEKYASLDPKPRIVLKDRPDMIVMDDLLSTKELKFY